jgi:hypothetical protein
MSVAHLFGCVQNLSLTAFAIDAKHHFFSEKETKTAYTVGRKEKSQWQFIILRQRL